MPLPTDCFACDYRYIVRGTLKCANPGAIPRPWVVVEGEPKEWCLVGRIIRKGIENADRRVQLIEEIRLLCARKIAEGWDSAIVRSALSGASEYYR